MPCSMPLRAAASAVTCAAKGVDLREPLKPAPPADSHAITLPSRSVRATIVLLNDVLMCAWPIGMFFLTLRRPRCGRRGAGLTSSPPSSCRRSTCAWDPCACARSSWCSGRAREAAAVADAAVAADLHQALDGLGALAAEVALNGVVAVDQVAELRDLVLGQVPHVGVRADAELGEELVRRGPADPVDVREADLDALVEGDVDPRNPSQSRSTPDAACDAGSGRSRARGHAGG